MVASHRVQTPGQPVGNILEAQLHQGQNGPPTSIHQETLSKRRRPAKANCNKKQKWEIIDSQGGQELTAAEQLQNDSSQIEDGVGGVLPTTGSLDIFSQQPDVAAVLENLLRAVQDPTVFLQPSQQLSHTARQAAQALHQHGSQALLGIAGKHKKDKAELLNSLGGSSKHQQHFLPELCVDASFDAEQIWMQMDMATATALKRARHMIPSAQSLLKPEGHLLKPEHEAAVDAILSGGEGGSRREEDESGSEDEDGAGPSKKRQKRSEGKLGSEEGDDSDDDMEALLDGGGRDDYDDDGEGDEEGFFGDGRSEGEGDDEGRQQNRGADRNQEKLLPTEDQFMRLSEMDAFLQDAEKQDARRRQRQNQEEEEGGSENEEDMDEEDENDALLFGSEDDEGKGFDEDLSSSRAKKKAGEKAKSARDMMYSDFFGDDRGGRRFWGADDGGAVPRGEGSKGPHRKCSADPEDLEDAPFAVHAGQYNDEEDLDEGSSEGEEGVSGEESSSGSEDEEGGKPKSTVDKANLSTHEKRQLRVQERVKELEAEAMAEKEWHLRGEVAAMHRPLNSALEVDLDFDTTAKPPPEPTEEAMADIEALIKRRIADHQFDDVVRVLPPPPERKRREVDLDDNKASKGLGEVYEEQYVRNVAGNTSEDKEEKVRNQARMLFQAVVGKLDALTHFHFAPKPVVEDLNVRSDVAAVVMEEAAPVAAGNAGASMQLPGEVYRPQDAGAPKAEGEMSREDRKRQRAQHKRAAKAASEQKQAERNARAATTGQKLPLPSDSAALAPIAGRKSAALAAATSGKKGAKTAAKAAAAAAGQGALKHGKTEFGRSGAVFAKLQQEQDQARAHGGQLPKKKGQQQDGGKPALAAAFLKL